MRLCEQGWLGTAACVIGREACGVGPGCLRACHRSVRHLSRQTERAYTNPVTLLELYFAAIEKKTIVCMRLLGTVYDFAEAQP